MEYVYAALLLHKLDKKIDETSMKKLMDATGSNPDEIKIKALVSALDGVDIEEALKTAVTTPAAVQPTSTTTPAEETKDEKAEGEKKEEQKDEKKDEEALSGLSSLFG